VKPTIIEDFKLCCFSLLQIILMQYNDEYLDDAIVLEERRIESYEAQLVILNARQRQATAASSEALANLQCDEGAVTAHIPNVTKEVENDAASSALDWILQVAPSIEPLLVKDEAVLEEMTAKIMDNIRLQSRLRNFCFTTVEVGKRQRPSSDALDDPNKREEYTFEGYFLPNRSVEARIRMVFASEQNESPTIADIECQLKSSGTPDDWSWLQKQVQDSIHQRETTRKSIHYLASWITYVAEYLEFDSQRRKRLSERDRQSGTDSCQCWKRVTVTHGTNRSFLSVPISSRPYVSDRGGECEDDSLSDNSFLSNPSIKLSWGWHWKERRDFLLIANDKRDAPTTFSQYDLDQLIAECHHDCWLTIKYLTAYCSCCSSCRKRPHTPKTKSGTERGRLPHPRKAMGTPIKKSTPTRKAKRLDSLQTLELLGNDKFHGAEDSTSRTNHEDEWSSRERAVDSPRAESEPDDSPFRLSPSGRLRSDYEVQRFLRIQRNEEKLTQLGLLHLGDVDDLSKKRSAKGSTNYLADSAKRCKQGSDFAGAKKCPSVRLSPRFESLEGSDTHSESKVTRDSKNCAYDKRSESRQLALPRTSTAAKASPTELILLNALPSTPRAVLGRFLQSGNAMRSDGRISPKNSPQRNPQSNSKLFIRPRGRPPNGYDWNATIGVWEPVDHDTTNGRGCS
jgi:hypothetical protein